jgi:hypothetical protein
MKYNISLYCCKCDINFDYKVNGKTLAMFSKDNTIRDGETILQCPICGSEELIFDEYKLKKHLL